MSQDLSRENQSIREADPQAPLRKWAGIVYLLQILSFAFGGITLIVGIIINYLKRADVQGTWLESHFTWQITTFWYILALVILGVLTFRVLIGYILLILAAIVLVYRVFRGWSRWNINQGIEQSVL